MSDQYLGEIRAVAFGAIPRGWVQCNGQLLAIAQYQALFALLGTTYGGDGRTSFGLPDLRGRLPAHAGMGSGPFQLGQVGGEVNHTLTQTETPPHYHSLMVSTDTTNAVFDPTGAYLAPLPASFALDTVTPLIAFKSTVMSSAGGSQPHANMMPYLALNYIIATVGIFPSRN